MARFLRSDDIRLLFRRVSVSERVAAETFSGRFFLGYSCVPGEFRLMVVAGDEFDDFGSVSVSMVPVG